jgi:hypothetical protein
MKIEPHFNAAMVMTLHPNLDFLHSTKITSLTPTWLSTFQTTHPAVMSNLAFFLRFLRVLSLKVVVTMREQALVAFLAQP